MLNYPTHLFLIFYEFISIVPPFSIQITDDDGHKLKGVIGPYDEGAYLSLLCEAEGGKCFLFYNGYKCNSGNYSFFFIFRSYICF